ncbi:hypothetical protein VTK56DRAFT_4354 [Thermocarpiscus australiensis]
MKIDQRLRLCLDIGRAIVDMHANRIVHGDIKPDNVLVFKEKSGEYHAKVIDFGYSARYIDDNHRLTLTGTELWNAPEHGSYASSWTLLQAVNADLFSLGMLFLWLLFEPRLSGTAPLPEGSEVADTGLARDTLYRKKRQLQTYTRLLLVSETAFEEDESIALGEFFSLSLSKVPEQRKMSLLELLRKLDPHRTNVQEVALNNPTDDTRDSDFKIEKSLYDFYRTDYRVRSYIAQSLTDHSGPIALQAALCYYIGFGVIRNEANAKEILDQGGQNIQAIHDLMSTPHDTWRYESTTVSELRALGHALWTNFAYIYLTQGTIEKARAQLARERQDICTSFRNDHPLALIASTSLTHVYTIQG